jgi:hypothetical protein
MLLVTLHCRLRQVFWVTLSRFVLKYQGFGYSNTSRYTIVCVGLQYHVMGYFTRSGLRLRVLGYGTIFLAKITCFGLR